MKNILNKNSESVEIEEFSKLLALTVLLITLMQIKKRNWIPNASLLVKSGLVLRWRWHRTVEWDIYVMVSV